MKIIIDSREPPKLDKKFLEIGIEVERRFLLVGDIIYGDMCFERKEIGDWVNSFHGHLWTQLKNMNENYQKNYLIIVGKYADLYFKGVQCTVEQHIGALASVATNYNVKIIQVDNDIQYVSLIKKLIEKTENSTTHLVVEKLSKEDDIHLRMLMQVPSVGKKRAEEILKKYKFYQLFSVSLDELKECCGNKVAENVKKWLYI